MKTNANWLNVSVLILILIIIALIKLAFAAPKIVPYVNDYANLLSTDQEQALNIKLDSIENYSTYEIAIVTVENTEGIERVEYANRIGDENGVGKKDKDNGIVVLWSQENIKGGAIATGRGSESIFNDAKVGRIGRDSRHFFDEGNYYGGFDYIVNELDKEINESINAPNINLLPNPNKKEFTFSSGFFFFPIFIFLFIWIIKYIFKSSQDEEDTDYDESDEDDDDDSSRPYKYKTVNGKRKRYYLYGAAATAYLASRDFDDDDDYSYSSSSSSSSGSSSSSFGGGSFGGGGAGF